MGDTGALLIGMMLSILAIYFINANNDLPDSNPYKFNGSISTAICIIIITLIDTMRIILLILYKRKSPFSPDKSHIHHAIMRLGFSHSKATLTLAFFHVFFISLAVVCKDMEDSVLLLGVGILTLGFSVILDRLILRKLDGNPAEQDRRENM
jgi:UDP-N-acetylmuramyl pentapeptide phosphotransferase/UDP-N-acetylglucosamine-1-phosphate transferase